MAIKKSRPKFSVRIFDRHGDFKADITNRADVTWEYYRIGGCGQCNVMMMQSVGETFDLKPRSQDQIQIMIGDELRYAGKLQRVDRTIAQASESVGLIFYGYLGELDDVNVKKNYEGYEISTIIKDILDTYVVGVTKITYNDADIESTGYSLESVSFNHTAKEALAFLASIAFNVEWGVDRNKQFYFKSENKETVRHYSQTKDISAYKENWSYDKIRNRAYMYGNNSDEVLAVVNAPSSQQVDGIKEVNYFESSITEASDANRIGVAKIKSIAAPLRQIAFKMFRDDAFIESSHPIGGTAIVFDRIQPLILYGDYDLYGERFKYGNVKQDQVERISYKVNGGGLEVDMALQQPIPNVGSQTKRIEYEIRDLQRR